MNKLTEKNTMKTYFMLWQKGMVTKPTHCYSNHNAKWCKANAVP